MNSRLMTVCSRFGSRRLASVSICLFVAVLALHEVAHGQDYPSRPITLVAPSTPGSAPDVLSRIIARKLSEQLGQQMVVLNRPGAGTNIGTASVAQAAADGYTLLLGSIANTLNPHIMRTGRLSPGGFRTGVERCGGSRRSGGPPIDPRGERPGVDRAH